MLAQNLIAASAAIVLAMGTGHMGLTFFSRAFSPRDSALEERMKSVSTFFHKQMQMWNAWVGFNASHSMGPMLFGLIYGYLALAHGALLLGSPYLLALGGATLLMYVFLAACYWFYLPLIGVSTALAVYAAGVAVAFSS